MLSEGLLGLIVGPSLYHSASQVLLRYPLSLYYHVLISSFFLLVVNSQ